VLVFQTVGAWPAIAASEWIGTPGAFLVSRAIGYITPRRCPVWPRRLYTPASLRCWAHNWGFEARLLDKGRGWPLRDDLYALEPAR
jgi:hypothetical protein